MDASAGGWFTATVPGDVLDYAFRLDGGEPLPDPRSAWQPAGVHGPSRAFDAGAHRWADEGFTPVPLARAVLYELHVGTFTPQGTFAAVAEHLGHLADLGVTHVELLPVAAFAGRWGWGYDGVCLYAPHPAYGSPADLQELVDRCHQAGLAVVLDVVYNHLGPEGGVLDRFGPYPSDRHRTTWGPAFNLDGEGSDEVRRFLVENATRWLRDFRFDGLRLDAVDAMVDTSAVHLLEQLRRAVDEVIADTGRPKVLIAEHGGNDPRLVRPVHGGGYGMDAVWVDDVHHSLHTAITDERVGYYRDYEGLADVARCWRAGWAFAGRWSSHRGRTIGRSFLDGAGGRAGDALVACLQDHDHVGNRARGERISSTASPARHRVAAALLLTGPFVPLLFQGEEWAASTPFPYFADHSGELAEVVRAGRLAEFARFGWHPADVADPEDEATFRAAVLRWEELDEPEHAAMLGWYGALLALRAREPDLREPSFASTAVTVDEDARVIVVRRGAFSVAACLSPADVTEIPVGPGRTLLLASDDTVTVAGDRLRLGPDSAAVLRHSISR
jgi:maltooligosyltrehalose trehalohydrolase